MKIVTVLFSCVVFTIVSYIPCNAQPTFEENIIKEEIVTKAILEKTYPDLGFYIQTSTITMPPSTRIVAKKNDRLFLIPDEINLINKSILQDSDPPTKDLLESFVELFFYSVGREIKILSSEAIELTVEGDFYNYEMVTLVDNIEYRILFFYHENNIIRVSIFARYGKISEINPVLTILRDVSLEILGTDVKVETYGTKTHHYIAVSDNDTATNYTMTFNVTGLQPNQQNVRLVIEPIYWNGATYFLEQLLTVDISGNATYTWTPANDTNTGICNVGIAYETGGFFFNDFWVIPEHILTGTFTNGYDYTTYYTDQFFLYHPQGINHASVYAANAESALTNSWDKEINEWDLCQGTNGGIPIDNDDNYELCINDHGNPVSHIYHGTGDGAFAYGGIDRKIGIPCRYYEVHPNYTTENFMLLSVMSHEFYHGVQWSHNNGWGSNACNWMVEGQARFLQSVFMGEYSDPNEEFLPGRSYTLEATEYLKYSMSYGLSWVSYAYCMFWRFLFENYATGSTTDKLAIIRETCKGNTDPNTAAIKSFMDSKLNGNYSSFDEALKDFAKRCYLNDTTYHQWSPCPSDDYYITPTVTKDFDSDGITGTFKGFPLVVQDGIASCFTIDYLSFDFTEEFDYVYLKFDADPEDNGIMAEFYVNVLQFDGDSLLSENVLTLSGGEGSLAFSVTSPDFKIVPVIVRLDTNQSCFEHEYSLQLSKGVDVAIVIDRSGSMGPIYEYSILYVGADAPYPAYY